MTYAQTCKTCGKKIRILRGVRIKSIIYMLIYGCLKFTSDWEKYEMLIEITGNEEFKRLLGIDSGFLIIADYPSNVLTIHTINCKLCDPEANKSLSISVKRQDNKGEMWYSDKRQTIISKANEISEKRNCEISLCDICKP